jgi:hypothetical protein
MEGWDNAWSTTLDNFSNEKLYVNPDFILKGLGMKRGDADEYLLSLIDELIAKSFELEEPRSAFIIYDSPSFDNVNHQIAIDEVIFDTGKIVTNSLKKSSSLILFTATIGEKMEHFSKQLMKEGHTLEGLIVDLIGSALVEAVVEHLHRHIEQTASNLGLNVSNRYSPGYCNWPVSDQQKLFPLLKGNDCGIILTESSLMLPVKSVSGVIGIGAELKKANYKCNVCSDVNCIMRLREEEREF